MIRSQNFKRKWIEVKEIVLDGLDKIHQNEKVFNAEYTKKLEEKLKIASGRKYALTCASGSHAISMALLASGLSSGDKVIIPNYSCPATLSSVMVIGCIPIYCEIDNHGSMNINTLKDTDISGVKAVLATGLYGDVHNHNEIQKFCHDNKLVYVNDAAQSQFSLFHNTNSLELGDVVCMSFADNKPLPVAGTYGAVLTDDPDVKDMIISLRKNGKPARAESYSAPGFSSQPEEEKALQVIASWQHFDRWQKRKKQISEYYDSNFLGKIMVRPSPDFSQTNYHKYAILVDDKFEAHKILLGQGIETEQHYTENFAELPWTPVVSTKFPVTDKFIKCSLTLPSNPFMTDQEVEQVVTSVINNVRSAII